MLTTTPMIDPVEARRERIRREKARRELIEFSEYVAPWYRAAAHHRLVASYLQEVARYIISGGRQGIGRLMIFEPPRHGKTEQVAQMFPAWLLGKRPDTRVILACYGADLAQKSSRAVRNYITSDRYKAIFGERSALDVPVEMSEDSRSASSWDLAAPHRGGLVAAGVRGGLTGHGAHLSIIDDPYKDRKEAESENYRNDVGSWYGSSFYTRLEPAAAVVVQHTRWHKDDQAGRLLKAMLADPLADQWTVLDLPALAHPQEFYAVDEAQQRAALAEGLWLNREDPLGRDPGEPLWLEKYSAEKLAQIKANMDEADLRDWPALYQQQPIAEDGEFFARSDFDIVDSAPAGLRWVRYVDLAIAGKQTSDFNATVATAMDGEGTVYYRDMLRTRNFFDFKAQLRQAMLSPEERGTTWGIEDTQFQALVVKEFLRDAEFAAVDIRGITPETDKGTAARPLQGRAKQGKVKLVRGPWVSAFVTEAVAFRPDVPGGHDDQIDTAARGLGMLAQTLTGQLVY